MTTKELESKIYVCGDKVEVMYHGKSNLFATNNTLALDRIKEHKNNYVNDMVVSCRYTYKQALEALWDEFNMIRTAIKERI